MPTYSIFDLSLETQLPFPELAPAEAGPRSIRLDVVPGKPASGRSWFHHHRLPDGTVWMSKGRIPGGYLVRFPDLADFEISPDGREVVCRPCQEVPDLTLRHLFLDQIAPLLMGLHGRLALHAGGVSMPEGPVVVLGNSGAGKSTLVAHLALQGDPLLGDDSLVFERAGERIRVVPAYSSLRLWEDVAQPMLKSTVPLERVAHYSPKVRVSPSHWGLTFHPGSALITRAYLLPDEDERAPERGVSIVPVGRQEAFLGIIEQARFLDHEDRTCLERSFLQCCDLVAHLDFFKILFPRTLDALPEVREALRRHLRGQG